MSTKAETFFSEWLDIMLDTTKSEYHNDLEPFNVYKERMKAQGVKVFNEYVGSIQNGYDLILNQIKIDEK
jgi:hypothetical protein